MAGSGTRPGMGTDRLPIPLIVTTPFAADAEVVDGAGGIVAVVEDDVLVPGACVDVDAAVELGCEAGGSELPLEHAAPNATQPATTATTTDGTLNGRPVSGRPRV